MNTKKKFIITIDTEGDRLWSWKPGDLITTENTMYLNRFQKIAEYYGFKPVWLTNYEMIMDDRFIEFIGDVTSRNMGEIGMHLHAWNSPPLYNLPQGKNGQPYLIEYPTEIMEEKIKNMTDIIKSKTGIQPVSHRAGRWATDERYFKILDKYGYLVDCSVTPHKDWSSYCGQTINSAGSNYKNASEMPGLIKGTNIIEIPVSIVYSHKLVHHIKDGIKPVVKDLFFGRDLWLRPGNDNLNAMLYVLEKVKNSNNDYIMFMLHSSEMMPNGSPNFPDNESIEKMYDNLDCLFRIASESFEGITLQEYSMLLRNMSNCSEFRFNL